MGRFLSPPPSVGWGGGMGHAGRGPHIVVFIGPAGSGKTSLTLAFGRWVERTQGLRVAYVNLDPGAETVPYDPGFDVRRYVRVSEVMRRYGLGPNGAFLMSAELMLERVDEIIKGVGSLDADYVLVDTPGQMELFVFHRLGPEMTARLAGIGTPVAVVILDPTLIRGPADVVALRLLTTLVQLRLSVESVPVINKADVGWMETDEGKLLENCLLYTSPSPRDRG